MIRKFTSLMAILALGFIASSASAVGFVQSTPGGEVTIAVNTTKIPGGTSVAFQPSAQVNVSGVSVMTSFAVMTGHEAVKGKEAGQNYGMSADSSNVFWIAAPATYTDITTTNSLGFSSYNRT
jgi:hypothetical protein